MKFACATVLLLAAVIGANANVDWQSVKSLDIEVEVPLIRRYGIPDGRITKGEHAKPGQFPYQAGLLLYVNGGAAWCGGSLISDRWIVTAAHCTDSLTTGVDVYLGAWNRADKEEKGQQVIFVEAKHVIVHENWQPSTLSNDISLIELPDSIEFNDRIQPVKLPAKSSAYNTYAGQQAVASGWGKTSDAATAVTDILEYIDVPIMNNSGCAPWFGGSEIITDNHICIKTTGGTSTCNGDSGGPLVSTVTKELIGATSFGIALGCEKGWPGVFTRITSYLDWIEKHTGVTNKGF